MLTTAAIEARARAVLRKATRPLAIHGPSGSGKTSLLRRVATVGPVQWCTARDFADDAVEAMRAGRYAAFTDSLATDPRPLVIEQTSGAQRLESRFVAALPPRAR